MDKHRSRFRSRLNTVSDRRRIIQRKLSEYENNFDGEKIFNQALDQTENAVINENFKLAQSLGLRGTPASVINDSIYPGYIKYEVLSNLVK